MICNKKTLRCLLLICILYSLQFSVYAQSDTLPKKLQSDTISKKTGIDTLSEKSLRDTLLKNSEKDTIQKKSLDEYLKTRKGFLVKCLKALQEIQQKCKKQTI